MIIGEINKCIQFCVHGVVGDNTLQHLPRFQLFGAYDIDFAGVDKVPFCIGIDRIPPDHRRIVGAVLQGRGVYRFAKLAAEGFIAISKVEVG